MFAHIRRDVSKPLLDGLTLALDELNPGDLACETGQSVDHSSRPGYVPGPRYPWGLI